MRTPPKVETLETTNLQSGEILNLESIFYNLTYIRGFTATLTVVYAKTRMLWTPPTESKRALVRIIRFILTTFNNEKLPYRFMIVNEYGSSDGIYDEVNSRGGDKTVSIILLIVK